MFRKLAVGAVMSLGLLAPMAAAPAAQAHEDYHHRHYFHRFEVLYRPCGRPYWECYGRYGRWVDADRAACSLRARGFEVSIRS
jgi:hypothetical protein